MLCGISRPSPVTPASPDGVTCFTEVSASRGLGGKTGLRETAKIQSTSWGCCGSRSAHPKYGGVQRPEVAIWGRQLLSEGPPRREGHRGFRRWVTGGGIGGQPLLAAAARLGVEHRAARRAQPPLERGLLRRPAARLRVDDGLRHVSRLMRRCCCWTRQALKACKTCLWVRV